MVFLNNDTTVPAGLARAAARGPRGRPTSSAPSRCCSTRRGSVQSAGIAFPTTGGLPHAFLQGFPVEDAARRRRPAASTRSPARRSPCGARTRWRCAASTRSSPTAWRTSTSATGWPSSGPATSASSPRRPSCTTSPARPAATTSTSPTARSTSTAGSGSSSRATTPRSGPPAGCAWSTTTSAGHGTASSPACASRSRCWSASQRTAPGCAGPSRTPLPPVPGGERWGDTHFAAALAAGAARLGQEVVVDRRPEWDRATGRHDDVVLVLRGLVRHDPSPEQVVAALGDLAPRRRDARGGPRLRPGAARAWADDLPTIGDVPVDAPAPGHRPGAVPPRRRRRPARRARRPVRRQLPAACCGRWSATRWPPTSRSRCTATSGRAWCPTRWSAAGRSPTTPSPRRTARRGWSSTTTTTRCGPRGSSPTGSSTRSRRGARVISDPVDGLAELFGPVGAGLRRRRRPAPGWPRCRTPTPSSATPAARRATADRVRAEHSFGARAARLVEVALEARAARTR